jgi:hypothetical protein
MAKSTINEKVFTPMMHPAPANSEVDTEVNKGGVSNLQTQAMSQEKGRTCYDLGTFLFKNSAKAPIDVRT